MPEHLPHVRTLIGSSYLIQQSPGAEQVGGLEVRLRYCPDGSGKVLVENTLKKLDGSGGDIRGKVEPYSSEALRGVSAFLKENNVPVERFEIKLGNFFIHDVDSAPHLYFLAAQNAMRAALAMWNPPTSTQLAEGAR